MHFQLLVSGGVLIFVAYLAGSAGRVVIPEAVEVIAADVDDIISFVDRNGRTLVTFRRPDLALYSKDSDPVGELLALDGNQGVN